VIEKEPSVWSFVQKIVTNNLLVLQQLPTVPRHISLALTKILFIICEIQRVYHLVLVFQKDANNRIGKRLSVG
jgi:hypothetical protein